MNDERTEELKDDMRDHIRTLQRSISAYHYAAKRAEGYARDALARIQNLRRELGE